MSSNKITFWTITDMIKYASEIYPTVKQNIDELGDDVTYQKKIYRTFEKHKIMPVLENGIEKYKLSEPFAKFMIEDILFDYFTKDDNEAIQKRKSQRKDDHRKKVLKAMEEKSSLKDKQINDKRSIEMEIENLELIAGDVGYDTDLTAQKNANELKKDSGNYHFFSNGYSKNKNKLEYHISQTPIEQLSDNCIDDIIDRTMLRAIFDIFYDFKEQEFRIDLHERALHIEDNSTPIPYYEPGFSELSRKLENPIGNYIFPKNKKKGNRK